MYPIQTICSVVEGTFLSPSSDDPIEHLVYDSRRIQQPGTSLFFALKTSHNDGHKFIADAYQKGIRNFIVSERVEGSGLAGANLILVNDTLAALQKLAAFHRAHFQIPVIGITGSNGKTIVKEWLYQLLHDDFKIVRSPKSFNSQIGVPLSVWQMNEQHTLAIFEAGISSAGEMENLEKIIRPTIGLLTNIGEAHDAGFESQEQKLSEKIKLFKEAQVLIGEKKLVRKADRVKEHFSWAMGAKAGLEILSINKEKDHTVIKAGYRQKEQSITLPFTDEASIENAINCWCAALYLQLDETTIRERFLKLHPVDMRLQLKHGMNDCLVVNDSYSADTTSLKIAFGFFEAAKLRPEKDGYLIRFF